MLLVPAEAIRATLGPPAEQLSIHAAPEIITRFRKHFGVGFQAMAWHLFNLGYCNFHEDDVARLSSYGDDVEVTGFEDDHGRDGLERRVHDALRRDIISGERARAILGTYISATA